MALVLVGAAASVGLTTAGPAAPGPTEGAAAVAEGASSLPPPPSPSARASGLAKRSTATKSPAVKRSGRTVTVPARGPGTYVRAQAHARPASSRGRLYRFDVRVEKGLAIDADRAARTVAATLNDRRSWRGTGRWRFQLVPAGQDADLHVYLVTPGTTDRLCAPLQTRGEVSCQRGTKVVLNAKRWLRGATGYGADVAGYRRYLVNHEFGHALGYGHLTCPRQGRPAPVMLQQTKGLQGCRPNPWPATTGD